MRKKLLSLAAALALTTTLVSTAFADGTTAQVVDGVICVSNVTGTSTEFASDKHVDVIESHLSDDWLKFETENGWNYFGEFSWGDVKTYYCDGPAAVSFSMSNNEKNSAVNVARWWWLDGGTAISNELIENEFYDTSYYSGDLTMATSGTYLFLVGYWGEFNVGEPSSTAFYVVVNGETPAAAEPVTAVLETVEPIDTAPIDPAPVLPEVTVVTISAPVATLSTAEGLVNVIPPAPVADEDLIYAVQPGETLWSIAYNYYGSMGDAAINNIIKANADYFKETQNVLKENAVLVLPAKGLMNPVTQSSLSECAGLYLVKAGDTLGQIAQLYYGDSKAWTKIQEANKDRVTGSTIYEKQWLIIPR